MSPAARSHDDIRCGAGLLMTMGGSKAPSLGVDQLARSHARGASPSQTPQRGPGQLPHHPSNPCDIIWRGMRAGEAGSAVDALFRRKLSPLLIPTLSQVNSPPPTNSQLHASSTTDRASGTPSRCSYTTIVHEQTHTTANKSQHSVHPKRKHHAAWTTREGGQVACG